MDQAEWQEKERRLQEMLSQHNLDGVLLTKSANVAWLTGGGQTYINIATEGGVGSLLVIPNARYLLTDVIEAERLRDEEGFGERVPVDNGQWKILAEPWHEPKTRLRELTQGLRIGTDLSGTEMANISNDVARLRRLLTPAEAERFRAIGRDAGAAIGEAAAQVRPGMTEFAIAGLLAEATYRHGAVPIVVLVATDERLMQRRHPLPTARKMERTAMLVLCARRHGLVASATRIVHNGPVPDDLRRKMRAVATIEATAVKVTRPGVPIRDIFAAIQRAYETNGFPGEWQNHHQGGPTGYEPREYVATPNSDEVVEAVQAFAWNPSVPGAKSEDTFLVSDAGAELLTPSPGWPQIRVEVEGEAMERHDILQLG